MGLRVKDTGKRMLARSHGFKQLMKENRGIFLRAHKIIDQYYEELCKPGAQYIDKEKPLSIIRAATGSFKGTHNHITLRVKAAIEQMRKVMEYKHDVLEIWPGNAFYSPATDSVLLFDLQHFTV